MAAKLSVFLREPQFQGQTKEKLTSAEAARLVETALRDRFDHWLAGDPDARPTTCWPSSSSAPRSACAASESKDTAAQVRRRAGCACPAS